MPQGSKSPLYILTFVTMIVQLSVVAVTQTSQSKQAIAESYDKQGDTYYYDRKDYVQAFHLYEKAANLGDARAQRSLGFQYANGLGVKQDLEKAYYWWKKGADNGDVQAADSLAQMYALGAGPVRKDYKQAWYWANLAGAKGYTRVYYNIGKLLAGTNPPDPPAAVQFLEEGAKRGNQACAQLRDQVVAQWKVSPPASQASIAGCPPRSEPWTYSTHLRTGYPVTRTICADSACAKNCSRLFSADTICVKSCEVTCGDYARKVCSAQADTQNMTCYNAILTKCTVGTLDH